MCMCVRESSGRKIQKNYSDTRERGKGDRQWATYSRKFEILKKRNLKGQQTAKICQETCFPEHDVNNNNHIEGETR